MKPLHSGGLASEVLYNKLDASYDMKVLHDIITTINLNITIVNSLKFIPIALKHGSIKTYILQKMIEPTVTCNITEDDKKTFNDSKITFNDTAKLLMKSINSQILNFENYKKTKKTYILTKYIDLFLYINRTILMLPEGMVSILEKNISGVTSSRRSTSSRLSASTFGTEDLRKIENLGKSKGNINITIIFGYLEYIFSNIITVQFLLSLALGINNMMFKTLQTFINTTLTNRSAEFKLLITNIEKLSIVIKRDGCLKEQYDNTDFKNVIKSIDGIINLETYVYVDTKSNTKKLSSPKLYELQILYSFCIKILPFLSNDISYCEKIKCFPEELIKFDITKQVFNIEDNIIKESEKTINLLKELFHYIIPERQNTISVTVMNISFLILHTIFSYLKNKQLKSSGGTTTSPKKTNKIVKKKK